jgi:putative nucleotidyltransferase with HDIG domain
MKNGTSKGEIKRGIPRRELKAPFRIDRQSLNRILILLVFGLAASLSIQAVPDIESLTGGFLIASVLLFILYRDIVRYKPLYMNKFSMLLLLGLMLVGTLLMGRMFTYLLSGLSKGIGLISIEGAVFGMPLPAGAMLVTLLFDFHTAIIFSFIISILTGLWLHDSAFTIFVIVGSLVGAFSVIRCKKRSAIILAGFYVIAANIFMVIIISLFSGTLFSDRTSSALLFAAFGGLSVSVMVSLLLPFLEYSFTVTTDISLLELLDLNQPLMRNLMIAAPGTYHHSIIVGNLAEAAAEAAGVNPLLARVSAFYHDIGKIKMPDYFVENYRGPASKHDSLTPHMSSMIIVNHVKEGVEIARQHKLPQPVIDIIQQHHGTSLITYFYQKAKDQETNRQTDEAEYQYPGPKPQSRVAALVMMADEVEAASRVLSEPTPARISSLVNRIVNRIFLEGQLDECQLTLKDIHEVKRCFNYILTGIFHRRIDYPGFDFSTDESLHNKPPKPNKNKPAEDKKAPN